MDLKNNKIVVIINNKFYTFKSSYSIVKFFANENNIKDINLSDEMKYVLERRHIIQRILKLKKLQKLQKLQNYNKIDDFQYFKKDSTRDKYLNIDNFEIHKSTSIEIFIHN
jgi:hypothetical protein